jgi:hypothetical protein
LARISQGLAAVRDFSPAYARLGSKPECLPNARMSASAGCGHAVAYALGGFVPKAAVSTCSKKHSLFKDFVSALLELHRYVETERLGGLHVDHQFELSRGLYGKLTRFRALEDAIDIGRRAPKIIR